MSVSTITPRSTIRPPDPALDLVLERVVDVPADLVWAAWTRPEHLKKWFCPLPWTTIDCELDLRPGGIFRTVMRSPEGQDYPSEGCCLEVVEQRKFVWTSALGPGYRPGTAAGTPGDPLAFTAVISLEPQGQSTRYTALVIHGDAESRRRHEELGFHEGWGTALTQLVALAKTLRV
jgi:uncharacterized protein YndB with AHSA1/START domain